MVEKTLIRVNELGPLLDHDGKVLELKYPLHKDSKKKLLRELKDFITPFASEAADYTVTKALEPIKRNLLQLEAQ